MSDSHIVICIPGKWKNRAEIVQSIAEKSDGYVFAGAVMMEIASQEIFEVEIQEYDPDLKTAFQLEGAGRLSGHELNEIDNHNFVLYLKKEHTAKSNATKMVAAANAILKSGGLGVKVEAAGKAFSSSAWAALAKDKTDLKLYEAFVNLLKYGEETIYTCGMHNLGMGDTIMTGEDIPFAAKVLKTFCLYRILENPILSSGETFALNEQSPNFVLTIEPCTIYEADNPCFNPHKLWRLTWEARLKMEEEEF